MPGARSSGRSTCSRVGPSSTSSSTPASTGELSTDRTTDELVRRLRAAGCIAAEAEAAELLAATTDPGSLEAMVRRRECGEPLAWITGVAWFCGRRVTIDRGVFVPRPQTEELARRAAAVLPPGGRAADLCCGSGAVAVHLTHAVAGARVVAVDIDERAVACARRNGLAAVRADIADPLRSRSFDVVTAIAPYVPTDELHLLPGDVRRHEPVRALDGGDGGLRVVTEVVAAAARLLRPGGHVLLEVGGDQELHVTALLTGAAFESVTPWHDDVGDLRGVRAVLER